MITLITSGDLSIPNDDSVSGTGSLTIRPLSSAGTISVGDDALADTEVERHRFDGPGGWLHRASRLATPRAGTGFVYVKNATFTDPVNIVGGQIRVGGLNAGSSNNVTLTARLLGILVHAGSPRDITGNTIVLTANGDIADGGNSLIVNATSGVTTNSSSANGNQYLSTATSVSVISFNAGAGTVMLSGGTFGLSGSDVIHNNTRLNVNGAKLHLTATPTRSPA